MNERSDESTMDNGKQQARKTRVQAKPDTEADPADKTPHATKTLCAEITRARRAKGLTMKEAGDHLYLTSDTIRYIEEGEFHKLTRPSFTKGYLRAYAKLLELSSDDVVAMFEQEFPELSEQYTYTEKRSLMKADTKTELFTGSLSRICLVGILGLITIIAIVWWSIADAKATPEVATDIPLPLLSPQQGELLRCLAPGHEKMDFPSDSTAQ